MENKINDMIEVLNIVKKDVKKFAEKGNNAAGTRVRKAMQDLKKLAQELRIEIGEVKKSSK